MFDIINNLTNEGMMNRNIKIIGDFEIMRFNFLNKYEGPNGKITRKCCNFHYCQCIGRKAKPIETYQRNTLKDELLSLSICPEKRVNDLFECLVKKYGKEDKLMKYFNDYYMNNKHNPISAWNVSNEEHRTNNVSESFNQELRHYFKKKNYFNGNKQQSVISFERVLYQYINYREKCQKYETTKKRNKIVEWKDLLIKDLIEQEKKFDDEQLLVILRSVLKLGKHKIQKKKVDLRINKTGIEKDETINSKIEEILVDEEYFETKNDECIDNLDGN